MTLGLFEDEETPNPEHKKPTAKKEPTPSQAPMLLSDEELLGAEPTDPVDAGLWRIWRALHGIDKKLAKRYRAHDSVDNRALARLANAILFGIESDRPQVTPERLQKALLHLPRYIAHLRVGSGTTWQPVQGKES